MSDSPHIPEVPALTPYLDVEDGAAYLGVSPTTIRRMVEDGRVRALRLPPKVLRFTRHDLDAALRPVPAPGRD